ncbi:MAG: hypothetical protein AB1916_05900 [Thermodesulfobacteriota bacterium]
MAKPNYRQARRAVEEAKKKKQEEKRLRKLARKNAPEGEDPDLAGIGEYASADAEPEPGRDA